MTINAWVAYVIGGFYLLLLGALAVMLVINANERAALAAADAARALLQSQNREWAGKMAATDTALGKIKTADAANAKAIAKAERAAAASAKKLQDQAAAIAALTFTGSECDRVAALRKEYLEHLK